MLRQLIDYAVLAPSSHNCQPWLFRVGDDAIDLFADRSRSLPVTDPHDRQLHMGCGAALFNLRVALRCGGSAEHVQLLPNRGNDDHLARLRPVHRRVPQPLDRVLFDAIPRRRTNRRPFEVRPVGADLFEELAVAAEAEGAWLVRLHPVDKLRAAEIIARADRRQFADPAFRGELSHWLIRAGSARRDGIPCRAKGFGGPRGLAAPFLVRTFDRGDEVAARDQELAKGSPLLVVLGTAGDDPFDWMRAGQALQRVLLTATLHGISASFLNQAIELAELRPALHEIADHTGCPQLVLRMGYGPEVPAVPRRPVEEVIVVDRRGIPGARIVA